MNVNGIAFCGDSFCACVGPGSELWIDEDYESDWPYLMAQHFDAKVTCTGIHGVNFYHSVQSLFGLHSHHSVQTPLKETDLVVFVVSSPNRLINKDRLTMYRHWINQMANASPMYSSPQWPALQPPPELETKDSHKEPMHTTPLLTDLQNKRVNDLRSEPLTSKEIISKSMIARDYLYKVVDWQSLEVFQHAFIMFVDERMVAMKKKAIWLDAFHHSNRDIPGWCNEWQPKSGPRGNITLTEISASEGTRWATGTNLEPDDKRRNHISPKNNKALAAMLIDIIEKDQLETGILDMRPWFNISEHPANQLEDQFIYP